MKPELKSKIIREVIKEEELGRICMALLTLGIAPEKILVTYSFLAPPSLDVYNQWIGERSNWAIPTPYPEEKVCLSVGSLETMTNSSCFYVKTVHLINPCPELGEEPTFEKIKECEIEYSIEELSIRTEFKSVLSEAIRGYLDKYLDEYKELYNVPEELELLLERQDPYHSYVRTFGTILEIAYSRIHGQFSTPPILSKGSVLREITRNLI